jgi:hypothetical protein
MIGKCRLVQRDPTDSRRGTVTCSVDGCEKTFRVNLNNLRVGTGRRFCDEHMELDRAQRETLTNLGKLQNSAGEQAKAVLQTAVAIPRPAALTAEHNIIEAQAIADRLAWDKYAVKPPNALKGKAFGYTLVVGVHERVKGRSSISYKCTCLLCGRSSVKWNGQFKHGVVHRCMCMSPQRLKMAQDVLAVAESRGVNIGNAAEVIALAYKLNTAWGNTWLLQYNAGMLTTIEQEFVFSEREVLRSGMMTAEALMDSPIETIQPPQQIIMPTPDPLDDEDDFSDAFARVKGSSDDQT